MKKILLALLICTLLASYGYLFIYDDLPPRTGFRVDWEAARALAGEQGPQAIHSERIASGAFFGWMLAAGGDWNRHTMEFRSYQLLYADGSTLMIDAVHERSVHESMPLMTSYDDSAFARQQQALREASHIVVTHEHWDHICGLLPLMGERAVTARMFIPAAQRNSPRMRESGFDADTIALLPAVDYRDMTRLAPGVVLIAAPGHTPGNQIVYVRLADGSEYAFTGDIAWNAINFRERRAKSVLINLLARENRAQLNSQIAYFADLQSGSPIRLVIAHDPQSNADMLAKGWLADGFLLQEGL